MKSKSKSKAPPQAGDPLPLYYTWAHQPTASLRQGSFVVRRDQGRPTERLCQFQHGTFTGRVTAVPQGMIAMPRKQAERLLPENCQ